MSLNYITRTGIAGAPIDCVWKGKFSHIGPTQGTALHDSIDEITFCAAVALSASVEEWISIRFEGMVDTSICLRHADALRAYAVSPLYCVHPRLPEPEAPVAQSAVGNAVCLLRRGFTEDDWESPGTNPGAVTHLAFLARHVMPASGRKAFEGWLKWALKRLKEIAPSPDEPMPEFDDCASEAEYFEVGRPYFGEPLPPEALDPDFDYRPEMRRELLDRFLRSLDPSSNPCLRSPQAMLEAGFKGTPYRLD